MSTALAAMALGNVAGHADRRRLGAAASPVMLDLQAALYLVSGVLVLAVAAQPSTRPTPP